MNRKYIEILVIGLSLAGGIAPVSYTHLDVYKRQLESDAEQAVDDQRPAQPVGYRRECAAARIDKAPEGICRVNRQVLGRPDKNHLRVEEAFAQQYCDFKGVAAVVSGAGENQDTRATLGADCRGQVSRRLAGALHQGLIGGCGFDVAQVGGCLLYTSRCV